MSQPQVADAVESQPKESPQHPICCRKCGHTISKRSALTPEEHTFRNPAGYSFHVVVLEGAEGCQLVGRPVAEDSWFTGYHWTIAVCEKCQNHLGWLFGGGEKSEFFGLIATRLTL